MCGIVGFAGKKEAAEILLEGLAKLEYRGYDSAGIAVRGEEKIGVIRAKGRLQNLHDKAAEIGFPKGSVGIGHTRWATHGVPSEENAHPHTSSDGKVTLVHNGIIENEKELHVFLEEKGYTFSSQTDTEAAVNLISYNYTKTGDPLKAITASMAEIRGSYAFAILFEDHPDELFAARKESPLIIGVTEEESFIASDVPAILSRTRNVYYMDNMEVAKLTRGAVTFYDANENVIEKKMTTITWNAEAAEKDGYEHFMLKEIHEQPRAVRDTIRSFMKDGEIDFTGAGLTAEMLKDIEQIHIVACGSAYHVGVVASYVIEDIARIPVRVEYASEFRYRNPILTKHDLAIIISQSGETADSLSALREAKKQGVPTVAIVNVVASSIAREADHVLYTLAGPEIAVATTKAYSAQLSVCYLMAAALGRAKGAFADADYRKFVDEIMILPDKIEASLGESEKSRMKVLAEEFIDKTHLFMIGRGIDYAICMEGGLKVKEISYIHCEAYAAGELKHGTISLIEPGMPVVGVLTQPALFEKTLSNMREVKSRGAYLIGIATESFGIDEHTDVAVHIPETLPYFAPSLAVIPLQMLGYYLSTARGLDVDKPRNLAKSVTVE